MKEILRVATGIVACLACHPVFAQWVLDVHPGWNNVDGWTLNCALTNNSKTTVETFGSNLPWGTRDNLLLVVIPVAENGAALKAPLFIDDPKYDPISIRPGDVLKGRVLLDKRYPDLWRQNKEHSVGICYQYRFENIERGSKQVAEGCLLVEKKTLE